MNTLADRITASLSVLIGQPITDCGRAVNMQMFGFGPLRSTTDRKGRPRQVAQFALHIGCRWRVVDMDQILFGRDDLIYPADPAVPIDDFDWQNGDSVLDAKQREWFARHHAKPPRVTAARGDVYGGFRIELEGGCALECYPCGAGPADEDSELWRIFRPADESPHFVVTTTGVEPDDREPDTAT